MQASCLKPVPMSLKVLCDENLPHAVAEWFVEQKCDTASVTPGMTDAAIAALARREKRILISFDSDFANILNYPPQKFFGIVRLNISPPTISLALRALELVIKRFRTRKEFKGKLIIAEVDKFRVWTREK